MTSPKLLIGGLDQHKDSLEYLHINSINGYRRWNSFEEDFERFHGDEGSIDSEYDWEDDEQMKEHERRQRIACEELKQEYIQPIDLHEFTALKKVFVHHTDLLGSMNKENPTDFIPLASVLPPALEVLTLRYSNYFSDWDPQLEFIYNHDVGDWDYNDNAPWEVEEWVTKDHAEWYQSYYKHITNLLRDKAEKFPALKQVTMCLDKWPEPAKEMLELAAEVGVQLIIGAYVYEGHVNS
jgi:hypothetical protein